MKTLALLALVVSSITYGAVYEVGDSVANMCWKNAEDKEVCLNDGKGTVRVLVYNAGWCGPCNEELHDLAAKAKKYDGKAVTFLSLSADGWMKNSGPSAKFLKEWKEKHNIPFAVLASPKDAGKQFIAPPVYIPNVAVIGADGRLVYKDVAPDVETLFNIVDKALLND